MEKLEIFQETISEIKQVIFKIVMKDYYKQFVVEQEVLRKLTKKKSFPAGMTLAGNAFCEPKHRDIGCQCEEGFTVIKCSLDLSRW